MIVFLAGIKLVSRIDLGQYGDVSQLTQEVVEYDCYVGI